MANVHQDLMNEAYNWWQNEGKGASSEDFLIHCKEMSQKHLDAVVSGNLNYQVCNGGFPQWVDNGYAVSAWEHVEDLLIRLGTKNAKSILNMINAFKEYIDFDQESRGWCNYWIEEEERECSWCDNGVVEGLYDEETGDYEQDDCEHCGGSGYEEKPDISEGYSSSDSYSGDFWKISDAFEKEMEDFLNDKPLDKVEEETEKMETEVKEESSVKFPNIEVELVGHDGNAFAIMGRVSKAMQRAGVDRDVIDQYTKESMSGDYDHLLQVAMSYVNVT
jgi:hypothetical protein